jgi:hypothetical protein
VAATRTNKEGDLSPPTTTRYISKPSNEPVLYKRERNKINSLARALQLEHALYQDETVMRFAAISDQIKDVDKNIENLRLDMQEAIRREFMYLIQKMLSLKKADNNKTINDAQVSIDYGQRSWLVSFKVIIRTT